MPKEFMNTFSYLINYLFDDLWQNDMVGQHKNVPYCTSRSTEKFTIVIGII